MSPFARDAVGWYRNGSSGVYHEGLQESPGDPIRHCKPRRPVKPAAIALARVESHHDGAFVAFSSYDELAWIPTEGKTD